MHVDGADEGSELEVEFLGGEREQEWTVVVDLLHVTAQSALHDTVWVLDVPLQVRVQLLVVELRRLEFGAPETELGFTFVAYG